jgi:hypothetical protein
VVVAAELASKAVEDSMTIIPMGLASSRLGDRVGLAVLQEVGLVDLVLDQAHQEVDQGMVHQVVMEAEVVGIAETSNVKVLLLGTMTENQNGLDISGSWLVAVGAKGDCMWLRIIDGAPACKCRGWVVYCFLSRFCIFVFIHRSRKYHTRCTSTSIRPRQV